MLGGGVAPGGTRGAEGRCYRISACKTRDEKDDREQQSPDQCRPAKDRSEAEDSARQVGELRHAREGDRRDQK